MVLLEETVWVNRHFCVISLYERSLSQPISRSCESMIRPGLALADHARRYVEQEIAGDDTSALESVLQADVWRHKLITDEAELNAQLEGLEKKPEANGDSTEGEKASANANDAEKDELMARLGEIQKKLIDMEAETGPARAGLLLAGLGFSEADQTKPTRSFSGGWRMRLALARALFVKPDVS